MNFKKIIHNFFNFLDVLPLIVPAVLAAFGTVAMVLVLFHRLDDVLVWPLGIFAGLLTLIYIIKHGRIKRPGSIKEQRISDFLLLLGVVVWVVFNSFFFSQHIFTNRDPATYGVTGAWLVNHNTLDIDMATGVENLPETRVSSGGFKLKPGDDDTVQAQGNHLLPVFLGLGGRLVGMENFFVINVLFGGAALLAIYAYARMLVKPRWALISAMIMASSAPLIYFSRDTYSEPLSAVFVFGALALIWVAQKTRKAGFWFIAGLAAGAGTMVRIDAYLTVAALMAFVAVYLSLQARKDRMQAVKESAAMMSGMLLTSFVGWLDVSRLSSGYYDDRLHNILAEIGLIAAIVVLGLILIYICWRTPLLGWLNDATKKWRGPAVAILVLVWLGVLASRPLWYVSYTDNPSALVPGFQMGAGMPVEPRNYAEQTINWIIWYLGPIISIAGFIGLAIIASKSVNKKDLLYLAGLAVFFGSAGLYLVIPKISPDQIWAIRRFLPVVIPALTIYAVYALSKLTGLDKKKLYGADSPVVAAVLTTLGVLTPLVFSMVFLFVRENTQVARIEDVCSRVPDDSIVLWMGSASSRSLMPTRAYCEIPTLGYRPMALNDMQATQAFLKDYYEQSTKNNLVPVVGVFEKDYRKITEELDGEFELVHESESQALASSLYHPPFATYEGRAFVYMAQVGPGGDLSPLTSSP